MYGIQFASENNLAHLGIIVTSIFAAIANIGEISLEIFIPLLLMQTAIGKKSFKWAYSMTIGICIIECIFIIGKCVVIIKYNVHNVAINIWELCAHSLLLLLYIFIYVYVVYQRQYKKRNRARDRILKIYILCVSIIHIILIISYGLSSFNIDGFCLTVIGQYMYCIIFPFIAFITIRNDSLFWQNLFNQLQQATNTRIHLTEIEPINYEYKKSLHSLFGDNKNCENDEDIIEPLFEAASTIINIIDFRELLDISIDPIAAGSTSMVHVGYYKNKKVAIKQLYFDQLDLSLKFITDLFRESLNSNISHLNIVKFKGVCLRPPQLCLIYEYCNCGDLSHLLLWKYYYHSITKEKAVLIKRIRKIENRIKILIDICYGMIELHDNFIIHRDLKTDNILIQFDETAQIFYGKVCDFGSARNTKNLKLKRRDGNNSNKSWMSTSNSESGTKEETIISVDNIYYDMIDGNIKAIDRLYMTTKVGTFAFMAPELVKNIDIKKMRGVNIKQQKYDDDDDDIINDDYILLKDEEFKDEKHNDNDNKFLNTLKNKRMNDYKIPFHHNTTEFDIEIKANNDTQKKKNLTSLYDKGIDVFAFGVIMWEIGFLKRIYQGKELQIIHKMIINGKREYIKPYKQCQSNTDSGFYNVNIGVYNEYINLMNKCWSQHVQKRPKFNEIRAELEHVVDTYFNHKSVDIQQ